MNQNKRATRIFDLIIAISVGLLLAGTFFRIQHLPFETEVIFLSKVLLGVILICTGLRHYLNTKRNFLSSIGFYIILLIISIHFNKLLLFTKMTVLVSLLLFLSILWMLTFVLLALRKKAMCSSNKGKMVITIGLGCLIGEVILRSNHLPMSSVLSVTGLTITFIGLVISYRGNKYGIRNVI